MLWDLTEKISVVQEKHHRGGDLFCYLLSMTELFLPVLKKLPFWCCCLWSFVLLIAFLMGIPGSPLASGISLLSLPCFSVSYDCVLVGLMSGSLYCPVAVTSHSTSAHVFSDLCLCHSCCYSFPVCCTEVYSMNYSLCYTCECPEEGE